MPSPKGRRRAAGNLSEVLSKEIEAGHEKLDAGNCKRNQGNYQHRTASTGEIPTV